MNNSIERKSGQFQLFCKEKWLQALEQIKALKNFKLSELTYFQITALVLFAFVYIKLVILSRFF